MQNNQYLIHLLAQGGRVRLVPNRHLDESLFALYREACRSGGALYQDQRIGYTISVEGVHDLIDSLRRHGFQPNVSPQLFNLIANKNPLPSTNKVNDWINEIQSRLKKSELNLREYQQEAVRILHSQKSWLLLDEMGVGKTPQTLCAIPDNVPVLIVCPAIAKRNVWESEFAKFRPDYKTTVLTGLNSFCWPKAGDAVITSYQFLPEAVQF